MNYFKTNPMIIQLVALFFSSVALGYEETFKIEDDLPYWTIVSQLANVGILVSALYFTQRKNIAEAFKQKKEDYLRSVAAASDSKKEAENKLAKVSLRLKEMEASFKQQIEEAQKNAEESYRVQVADARNAAEKVKNMAQSTLEFEVQKQIENLRIETFQKSAGVAEQNLEKLLTPDQLKAWNTRFSQANEGAH